MTVEWSPRAVSTASRFLEDRGGIAAVLAAADALAEDSYPAGSFKWGEFQRLHVGAYRVLSALEGDLVTIHRVDCVT
jgi:hypothetical protein